MYVLDTNVISELRKVQAGKASTRFMRWADRASASSLYISSITVMELEIGALRIERCDTERGAVLRRWLDTQVLPSFADRILPIDEEVARRCAHLHVPDPRNERDALIAATALVHGMAVVTRDVADFAPTGVALVNPWDSAQ